MLDDLSSASQRNLPAMANVMFVEGGVLDEVELKRVFFEGPDLVFHLAALTRIPSTNPKPTCWSMAWAP
jgi:UDP-glucose 4-epimerase